MIIQIQPTIRIPLEYFNWTVIQHQPNDGYIGLWSRQGNVGYTLETLLRFEDLSALAGHTIEAVSLTFQATEQGTQTQPQTARLMLQNKKTPANWSNPPRFDDFIVGEAWNTELSSVTVQNIGTYTFPNTTAVRDLVRGWVNGTQNNWGLIMELNFQAVQWWLRIGSVTLNVQVQAPVQTDFHHLHKVGMGVGVGIGVGLR